MAHVCRESPKAAVAIAAMGFSLSVVVACAGVGVGAAVPARSYIVSSTRAYNHMPARGGVDEGICPN